MKLQIKTLYLSEKQIKYFEEESEKLKIKTSELIRRALDEYIKSKEKENV